MAKIFDTQKAHELATDSIKKSLIVPCGLILSKLDPDGTHLLTQAILVGETRSCLAMFKITGCTDPLRCRFDIDKDEWDALLEYPNEMPDLKVDEL